MADYCELAVCRGVSFNFTLNLLSCGGVVAISAGRLRQPTRRTKSLRRIISTRDGSRTRVLALLGHALTPMLLRHIYCHASDRAHFFHAPYMSIGPIQPCRYTAQGHTHTEDEERRSHQRTVSRSPLLAKPRYNSIRPYSLSSTSPKFLLPHSPECPEMHFRIISPTYTHVISNARQHTFCGASYMPLTYIRSPLIQFLYSYGNPVSEVRCRRFDWTQSNWFQNRGPSRWVYMDNATTNAAGDDSKLLITRY